MSKFRILDLFCGAGGCGYGYHLAGFEVEGVDIEPQPRYPFTFHQDDAFVYLKTCDLTRYDVIHASPPCQHYTAMLNNNQHLRINHPDLIAQVRSVLQTTGKPYIIENVERAKPYMIDPILLCGEMFPHLRTYRHRLFETNVFMFRHPHVKHKHKAAHASSIPKPGEYWSAVGCFGQKDDAQKAMGINWMKITGSRDVEIAQAVPPAYTEFLGKQMISYLEMEDGSVA